MHPFGHGTGLLPAHGQALLAHESSTCYPSARSNLLTISPVCTPPAPLPQAGEGDSVPTRITRNLLPRTPAVSRSRLPGWGTDADSASAFAALRPSPCPSPPSNRRSAPSSGGTARRPRCVCCREKTPPAPPLNGAADLRPPASRRP